MLRARFEDAQFFFQEDLKRPLSDFRPQLSGITFHKSLGTMFDKSVRIEWLYLTWLCSRRNTPSASQPRTQLALHPACCTHSPALLSFLWRCAHLQERVEQLIGPVGKAAGLPGAIQTAQQAAQLAHADLVNCACHACQNHVSTVHTQALHCEGALYAML